MKREAKTRREKPFFGVLKPELSILKTAVVTSVRKQPEANSINLLIDINKQLTTMLGGYINKDKIGNWFERTEVYIDAKKKRAVWLSTRKIIYL
jgi:hypothetical protein